MTDRFAEHAGSSAWGRKREFALGMSGRSGGPVCLASIDLR